MTATPVKTLIAIDDGVDPLTIETSVSGFAPLQVVGVGAGMNESWALLEETSSDLLVVATNGYSERALRLIEGAARQQPERPIVVLYTGVPDGFLQRAFSAGADDFVCLPQADEEVRFALEKVLARRRGGSAAVAVQAPMVVVLGPKGGTGKTLTACNLAVAFAKEGRRTALVDLDLQFGDVGIALGLSPERTIYDLVRAGGSLDAGKVEDYLTIHGGSGLRVLLAPTRPDQAGQVRLDFLAQVYKALRASSDVVVVDTPPAFSPEVIATIDSATHLCVVGMLDALSLKDSKLGLETLELMGHEAGKISLVLNRSTARAGISRQDAVAVLGRTPDVFVPEDAELSRLLTAGHPVVLANDRSPVARAFAGFADEYLRRFGGAEKTAVVTSNGHARKGGLIDLLLGRRKG
jgi:pilus assembly protein CpaE